MKIYSLAFLVLLQFLFAGNEGVSQSKMSSPLSDSVQVLMDSVQILDVNKPRLVNMVFKSADGGQTWQNISEGLPVAGQQDGIDRDYFFADAGGLYLVAGNWIYHNNPGSTDHSWNKQIFSEKQGSAGRGTMKVVESNGVRITTSQKGIIRSTDDGKNWEVVISEGGVGIAVERIKGGFAAITYNTTSKTRRVRTSYDGGKTWNPIDADLPPAPSIASIVQVGEYFFCGHPNGIYRSSDKGKTWELLRPSVENMIFNLYVSGDVIYAIPRPGGC